MKRLYLVSGNKALKRAKFFFLPSEVKSLNLIAIAKRPLQNKICKTIAERRSYFYFLSEQLLKLPV